MLTLEHIEAASRVISGVIRPTPLVYNPSLSRLTGSEVWLKAECLQQTGSFKIRGAYHKMALLGEEERARGVVTASAGNHAQGVSLAARELGIHATIVMPVGTPLTKEMRTRGFNPKAEVILSGSDYDAAQALAYELAREKGYTYVHAFDDLEVMAGQGTIGLELLAQGLPDFDVVLVPIGGGGMMAGIATVLRALRPRVTIVGVQVERCPSAFVALKEGHPQLVPSLDTIAEGIKVRKTGDKPFELLKRYVDEVVLVSEEQTAEAITWLLDDAKLVVEGSGAVAVAALLAGAVRWPGKRVAAVLSGGNIDLGLLARIVEHRLTQTWRYTWFELDVPDRPGELSKVVQVLAENKVNVLDVEHHRAGWRVPLNFVSISFLVETRNQGHADQVRRSLDERGYMVKSYGPRSG